MSRKVRRVPVDLDAGGIRQLPEDELRAILRGADELIMRGGRSLLAKVLRGSRMRKVLELGLDRSPAYGRFRDLSDDAVMARIDWVIMQGYLSIEYDYRLPLLAYTARGWEIEMETFASELLDGFEELLRAGPPYEMQYLKDRNRRMIMLLLDKVEASGDVRYIPLLEAWQKIDYKKVAQRIEQVIERLEPGRISCDGVDR